MMLLILLIVSSEIHVIITYIFYFRHEIRPESTMSTQQKCVSPLKLFSPKYFLNKVVIDHHLLTK